MDKLYYTVYKTTNKVTGKIYIGSHKTINLEDNYLGSGKYLNYSIQKHGIENFEKEILFIYDNSVDMYSKEAELVNDKFIAEENTYNLKRGGFGGFDYLNSDEFDNPTHSPEHAKMMYEAGNEKRVAGFRKRFDDKNYLLKHGQQSSKILKQLYDEGKRKPAFSGSQHTDESKKKISEAFERRELKKCPHCEVSSKNYGSLARWHFDNCKKKNTGP